MGLDDWLAEQISARNWRRIRLARREALAVLVPGPDAHDNVARWLKTHPGHTAVRGWLIHLDAFRGHSVVDAGVEWLDVTPRVGDAISTFCGGLAPMPRTGGSLRKWRGADY